VKSAGPPALRAVREVVRRQAARVQRIREVEREALEQQLANVHRAPQLPHAGRICTPVASTVLRRLSTAICQRQPGSSVPAQPSTDAPNALRPCPQSCPQSSRPVVKRREEPPCEEPEAESSLADISEIQQQQQQRQQQQHLGPQLQPEPQELQQHQPPPPAPTEVPEPKRLPSTYQRCDSGQEGTSQADCLDGPASPACLAVWAPAYNASVDSNDKSMVLHFQGVAGEDVGLLGFQIEFAHESRQVLVLHMEEASWAHGVGVADGDELISVQGSHTSTLSCADIVACLRDVRPLQLAFGRMTGAAAAAATAAAAAAQPPVHVEVEGAGCEQAMWTRVCPHTAPASIAVAVNEEPFYFNTGYEVPFLDPLGIFPEYGFREVPAQPQLDLIEASYAFPELLAWCRGDSSGSWHIEEVEDSRCNQATVSDHIGVPLSPGGLPVSLWFCDKTGPSTNSSPSCQTRRVVPGESIELLTMEEATEACSLLNQRRCALDA